MAAPTVLINSAGSNTQASGAGPSTAIFGTAAATTSNTTVVITDSGADPASITVGDVLWVASSSGRRWSKITDIAGAISNITLTVQRAYANTESGKTWAIGGKRATCAGSLQLFKDWEGDWTIDIQTGETLTADIIVTPSNTLAGHPSLLMSSVFDPTNWGSQPIIQTATSGVAGLDITSANYLTIYGINFKCTFGTPVEGNSGIVPKSGHTSFITIDSCILDGWYHGINSANGTYFRIEDPLLFNTEIKNCTHYGWEQGGDPGSLAGCYIHDNTIYGVHLNTVGAQGNSTITRSVFANNLQGGCFQNGGNVSLLIDHCSFYTNGTSTNLNGVMLGNTTKTAQISNCIFWNNGSGSGSSCGIDLAGSTSSANIHNNAFGGSNQLVNIRYPSVTFPTGNQQSVTLTASPFVSTTDFTLNSTAGGGALCKGVAWKVPNAAASAANGGDLGAIPSGGGAAGGAVLYYPSLDGL